MSFLGISQLTTAAYSPAASLASGVGAAAQGASAASDPVSFAERCTGAADALADSGYPAPEEFGGPNGALQFSGSSPAAAQGSSSPLDGLIGLVASLFGATGSGAGSALGLAGGLPGIAKSIAGLLA